MKPVVFLVFVIFSAGALYDMLLQPLLGFKAPDQATPVAPIIQPPIINYSVNPDQITDQISATENPQPVALTTSQTAATQPVSAEAETVALSAPAISEITASAEKFIEPPVHEELLSQEVAQQSSAPEITVVPNINEPQPLPEKNIHPQQATLSQQEQKMQAGLAARRPVTKTPARQKTQPPLSKESKEYLDRMNRLLDQELAD